MLIQFSSITVLPNQNSIQILSSSAKDYSVIIQLSQFNSVKSVTLLNIKCLLNPS